MDGTASESANAANGRTNESKKATGKKNTDPDTEREREHKAEGMFKLCYIKISVSHDELKTIFVPGHVITVITGATAERAI